MNDGISTAGVTLRYAVEQTAGTRPTTGYKVIDRVKSIPDLNPTPSNLEVTDLSDLEWKRYIPGLRDPGDALAFDANNTKAFHAAWNEMVEIAQTANTAGKAAWFAVVLPGLDDAFYFSGVPTSLGLSAMEVDAVAEITAYITPNAIAGWAAKPTGA